VAAQIMISEALVFIVAFFGSVKIPGCISFGLFLHRESITKILEPILGHIRVLPILKANMLHHMKPMNSTPRVQCHDRSICRAIFEPASARRRPGSSLHEFCNMRTKLGNRPGGWGYSLDILRLHLFDHVYDCNHGNQFTAISSRVLAPKTYSVGRVRFEV
jgi:hypothetical protein